MAKELAGELPKLIKTKLLVGIAGTQQVQLT
jgi:hypothetical protein